MANILVIDDDDSLREVVRFILNEAGHDVLTASNGAEGLEKLGPETDLVVSDIKMPGVDGMEFLRLVRDQDDSAASVPVIMLTAHGTVAQAVEAMKLGAFTYLLKPFAREELCLTVEQALRSQELETDNRRLRGLLQRRQENSGLVFVSQAMVSLMSDLHRAAPTDATILISGESGTGKELIARACHDLSAHWDQNFVAVNCGAIPATLMESELFGHVKGAFTGADKASLGRIRSADGGTLFLDEIAELPLEMQPKLLRVLESQQVDPLGSSTPVNVKFRLLCATNRDLQQEVSAGKFREDLLYRINVLNLILPPLRERPEDIPILWEHFTQMHAGTPVVSEKKLLTALTSRQWPGNVRELKNMNQRLVLMRNGDKITIEDLQRLAPNAGTVLPATPAMTTQTGGLPLGPLPESGMSLVELEKEVIRRALVLCGGNRSKTAAYLDIPRHVLVYRISKYELS